MKAQANPCSSSDFNRLSKAFRTLLVCPFAAKLNRIGRRAGQRDPDGGLWLLLAVVLVLVPGRTNAGGTWVPLTNQAPDNIDNLLLLSDGTVMVASGEPGAGGIGNAWYRLTPDANGSYLNGTWSTLAPMHYDRVYYSSQVLRDGRVLVAGGEYGTGTNSAEVYDPLANTWTVTPPPPSFHYTSRSRASLD